MRSMVLYPIYVPTASVGPHFTMQRAFEDEFYPCYTFDWISKVGVRKRGDRRIRQAKSTLHEVQLEFLEFVKAYRPEYAFMQLQNPDNMSVEMVREISKYTKVLNWTGDIRQTKEWYDWFIAIGKEIHLTLFTNTTDVEIMQKAGVRADYLQIGVDTAYYHPQERVKAGPEIVFSAHNYGTFELSEYRGKCAVALREEFGDRFKLYGGGWSSLGFKTETTNCQQEADAYRAAKIGISISNFNFKRYHSDRLLRIMACGCMAMSHDYQELEKDYTPGHDLVSFKNEKDLIDKCKKYLTDHVARTTIAVNGLKKIEASCTWPKRMEQLTQLLDKYE